MDSIGKIKGKNHQNICIKKSKIKKKNYIAFSTNSFQYEKPFTTQWCNFTLTSSNQCFGWNFLWCSLKDCTKNMVEWTKKSLLQSLIDLSMLHRAEKTIETENFDHFLPEQKLQY